MPAARLDLDEARVLGVLLEKEQTTPDHYPLTINAVIAGCNQKTNREPVIQMSETQVVEALDRLRLEVLAWRSEGARAERWQHSVTRRWHLSASRRPLLTLLLLRGAQTLGELKSRSERMHEFNSTDEVEALLREMAEGPEALVIPLGRGPGQREDRWTHCLTEEQIALSSGQAVPPKSQAALASASPTSASPEPSQPAAPPGPTAMERLEQLEKAVEELRADTAQLAETLTTLRQRLGE